MTSSDHKPTRVYEDSPYLRVLTGLPVKPGAIYSIVILHDEWCNLLNERGYCNCDPGVIRREVRSNDIG
jgi:hypothetical protein